jgi:hypothetical protein
MNYCTSCGSQLGVGRFCTNCGAPIAGREATAAPPPVAQPTVRRPVVAPDAVYGSRYPLYADDAATSVRPALPVPPPPAPVFAPAPPPAPTPTAPGGRRGPRRNNTPWVILLVLGILTAGITGFWLATRDASDNGSTADDERRTPGATGTATSEGTDSTDSSDDESDSTGDPTDVARSSRVDGPAPMPPGQDLEGDPVSFAASNMLDGNARTAYRVAGDATGSVIRFELLQEASITEVGLINGYAKSDTSGGRTVDWYARNRRVLQVEWRFDDGTTVVQDLAEQQTMQTEQIPEEVSQTVELRILEVSPPGRGALGKNVTAISDVLILGS